MIARIWHGWTTLENADRYEELLRGQIFPAIEAREVDGYRGIRLLRHPPAGGEVEFVTLMWFDDMQAVEQFAGADVERAHVPESARRVLARFDARSRHYELREHRDQ